MSLATVLPGYTTNYLKIIWHAIIFLAVSDHIMPWNNHEVLQTHTETHTL